MDKPKNEGLALPASIQANDDIQAARHLGRSAAREAGASYMGPGDEIPDGHATLLGDWFGRYTPEMAKAYREAFNETIRLLTGDE